MLKEKMTMMLKKMGASPDTLKAVESDSYSSKPVETPTASVTVVAVKKPEDSTEEETPNDKMESECANMTDDQINKMSESEAKDYIKKMRDSMKQDKEEDLMEEGKPTPNPKPEQSVAERVMNTPNFK